MRLELCIMPPVLLFFVCAGLCCAGCHCALLKAVLEGCA